MSCSSIVLEVLQQCNLHGAPRRVLTALAAYTEQYGPQVFPSLITLAHTADISERHVQRCLKQLATTGYLAIARRKEPGKNARNFYTMLFPWRIPAQKSTDTIPDLPAQKSTDTKMSVEDLKKNKERKERSGSTDIPRHIAPEVLAYPNGPNLVQWLGLTPGSYVYGAALSDPATTPIPVAPVPSREGYIFQYAHA
jgi:hypothetical protein